jgi:hypothetical protein
MYSSKYVQFVAHTSAYRHEGGCWHLVQRDVYFSGGFLTSVRFPDFTDCFMLRPPLSKSESCVDNALFCTCFCTNSCTRSYANAATLKPLQHVVACITVTFSQRRIPKLSPPARLDILRAVLLKIKIFWDVTPCGLVIRMTFRRTAVKEVWLGLSDPEDEGTKVLRNVTN